VVGPQAKPEVVLRTRLRELAVERPR
jgi:hypothetical protein